MNKILILYKDWLLHTRGEVRPKVGDKVLTTDNLNEKVEVLDIKKYEYFELQLLLSVIWEYLSDLYVEIEVDNLNFIK